MAWSAPSHYINQCWNVVNWAIRNKLQWNRTRNSYIFIPKNAFENVVGKMAAILSRPHCANHIACVIAVLWCLANLFALGLIELHPDICYGPEFRAGEMDSLINELSIHSQIYKCIPTTMVERWCDVISSLKYIRWSLECLNLPQIFNNLY